MQNVTLLFYKSNEIECLHLTLENMLPQNRTKHEIRYHKEN